MIKALFLNGSPRKNNNTAQLLLQAEKAARDAGAETELIHLYDYTYTGCKSCFACKLKNSKTNGVCILKDSLRPVLEQAVEADVLVVGSPVYFGYPTGQVRSFIERFGFPNMSYDCDAAGNRLNVAHKQIATATVYTMNCPADLMEQIQYPTTLGASAANLEIFGPTEVLYCCDTYQFSDYARYAAGMFDEPHKRQHRETQFPIDLQRAYDLGARLVEAVKGRNAG